MLLILHLVTGGHILYLYRSTTLITVTIPWSEHYTFNAAANCAKNRYTNDKNVKLCAIYEHFPKVIAYSNLLDANLANHDKL